jgi:hypothetical protein
LIWDQSEKIGQEEKGEVMTEIGDEEMIKTIADFIEMGHIDNIIAMFKQKTDYYRLTGELIQDERFMVRMGIVLLFEELGVERPKEISLAIPFLTPLLTEKTPRYVQGEVLTILGMIGGAEALGYVQRYLDHPDPQLAEIAGDYVEN